MYETLEFTTNGAIATVRLNRPQRLNAINRAMISELESVCRRIDTDQALRAAIITGAGRAFCAGADITVLDTIETPGDALDFLAAIQGATNAIEALRVPVIAAINGAAFGGGCEIALACDLRLMATSAAIGVPEIKIGLLPGAGGTQRLARLVPAALAKEMIYFGDPIDAARAVQHGLANTALDGAELGAEAMRWAERLSMLPPLALRAGKELVNTASLYGLRDGISAERQAVGHLFSSADGHEGLRAFLEKRQAAFAGR